MWRTLIALAAIGVVQCFTTSSGASTLLQSRSCRWSVRRFGAAASRTRVSSPGGGSSEVAVRMGTEFEDEAAKEKLRAMLNRQFGIGDSSRPEEWCKAADSVERGTVLLADPKPFVEGHDPKILEKFGLVQKLPSSDEIPPDRAADLLPVVLVVDIGMAGTMGVMLNRRTGVLMGDLGNDFKPFMIQPLWLGGTQGERSLAFIHSYPEVKGARPLLKEQGLYFGGDMESAGEVVTNGPGSGFNFRFFVQCTLWGPGELEKEVEMGLWRPVVGSKMALLRVRDRKGPDIAKPMWSDLSQMAGGEYLRVMQDFYRR